MDKTIKLNEIKRKVWKLENLNTFCKYTKDYQSLVDRLVITVIGKLDDNAAEWLKKQKYYSYDFKGIIIISLKELDLPKMML